MLYTYASRYTHTCIYTVHTVMYLNAYILSTNEIDINTVVIILAGWCVCINVCLRAVISFEINLIYSF